MTATLDRIPTIPSTQRVFDAVCEIRSLDGIATRDTVAELTGLKLTIVDDRLSALVDEGRLKRVLRGVYEVVEAYPEPRAISCTHLPNTWVKVEVGDEVLTLTPREARMLGRAVAGFAEDARVIESSKQHLVLATQLAAQVEQLKREVKALQHAQRGLAQPSFDFAVAGGLALQG